MKVLSATASIDEATDVLQGTLSRRRADGKVFRFRGVSYQELERILVLSSHQPTYFILCRRNQSWRSFTNLLDRSAVPVSSVGRRPQERSHIFNY